MTDFQDEMRRARQAAQEGDWAPDPGPHRAVVVATDTRTSRMGDAIVGIELELRDPAPGKDNGRRWEHPVFFTSERAREMAFETLSTYGITADAWDACEDPDDLARAVDDLIGTEVEVTVKPKDDGNGVWTNISLSRGQVEPDVPADQAGLDFGNGAGGQPAPKPDESDTIPF